MKTLRTKGAVYEALRDGCIVSVQINGCKFYVELHGEKLKLVDAITGIVVKTQFASKWKNNQAKTTLTYTVG